MHRREFLTQALALGGLVTLDMASADTRAAQGLLAADPAKTGAANARNGNPIGVSTYSFWRFQDDWKLSIPECISRSADMGFDFVEILEMQMDRKDAAAVRAIKRQALVLGMPLCGFSTHQGFLSLKSVGRIFKRRSPASSWLTPWASRRCGSTRGVGGPARVSTT